MATPAERTPLLIVPDPAPEGDLEAALAALEHAERPAAAQAPAAPGAAQVPAAPGAAENAQQHAALPAAAQAPTARASAPAATPATRAEPRAATAPPLPTTAPSLRVGRYTLLPGPRDRLLARQAAWIAWSALAGAVLAAAGAWSNAPLLAVLLCLGLGAVAAFPHRPLPGLAVLAGAVGLGLVVALARGADLAVTGPALLAAGAAVGVGLTALDGEPADRWRRLHGALGGAATAGLGWWVAAGLVGPPGGVPLDGALHGAALGLVASQALVPAALAWRETDRIPAAARVRSTLGEPYQQPCLRAAQLDRGFDAQAPDPDTRDGLGEVAAWVYRLQWTLQALDRELQAADDLALLERRVELTARAATASDEFTRERLEATARHLAQLAAHRRGLARERERTAALSEYASAYLEEARAGLALAQVQPGDHAPGRLDDVLGRLRAHAAEQDARRRTARELGGLA